MGQEQNPLAGCSKWRPSHPPNLGGYFIRPPCVCQESLFARGRALSRPRPQRTISLSGVAGIIPTARLPNSPIHFQGWPGRSSIARVERAHSYRARSASRRTARLPSHLPSSAVARCASTGSSQTTRLSQHPARIGSRDTLVRLVAGGLLRAQG